MAKRKEKGIPHIIIEETPANDLYLVVDSLMSGGTYLAQRAFEAITEEGRGFAQKTQRTEFKSAIVSEFFRDNEKLADFLSQIESILNGEPRLLAASEVVAKYLRESRTPNETSGRRTAKYQNGRASKKKPPQENEAFYFLLGLFSLARNAVTPSETSQTLPSVVNAEDNNSETEKAKRNANTVHTGPKRPKVSLLR